VLSLLSYTPGLIKLFIVAVIIGASLLRWLPTDCSFVAHVAQLRTAVVNIIHKLLALAIPMTWIRVPHPAVTAVS
jgi:hypothetical protein